MRQSPLLSTPISLEPAGARDVSVTMNAILADVFALYVKTMNFHWHMSGPHFRNHDLLLDDQADQIFAMAAPIAKRVRKLGELTIRSIGQIARTQRIADNDAECVAPIDMLAELAEDNRVLATSLRRAQNICDKNGDIATASLIEGWLDETQRRNWFLYEASRDGDSIAHSSSSTTNGG
jgi:starvation-inducible DNA-binding protein